MAGARESLVISCLEDEENLSRFRGTPPARGPHRGSHYALKVQKIWFLRTPIRRGPRAKRLRSVAAARPEKPLRTHLRSAASQRRRLGLSQMSVPFRSASELCCELRPWRLPLPCLRSEWWRHPRVRDGLQRVGLSHRRARSGSMAMTASPILESAIECARLGLSVHFQKGKNAFEPGWNSGPPKTEAQLQRDYQAGWNIGFQTGHRSRINGQGTVVLDLDLRSTDPEHVAAAELALKLLVGDSACRPSSPAGVVSTSTFDAQAIACQRSRPRSSDPLWRRLTASRRGRSSFWPLAMPARCRPASILKQASRTPG